MYTAGVNGDEDEALALRAAHIGRPTLKKKIKKRLTNKSQAIKLPIEPGMKMKLHHHTQ